MNFSANEISRQNEEELIEEIVRSTIASQEKSHKQGDLARRDVHGRSHGTLKAEFRVFENIPRKMRVGLFASPATYEAIVRLSSGNDLPDIFPNIRGIAIKLLGVPGKKLLPGEESCTEHDFLLSNNRTFFVDHIEWMALLVNKRMGEIARLHPAILLNLAQAMLKFVKNPLQVAYYSQVPYICGSKPVKYTLFPSERQQIFPPVNPFDKDFLRHAVERRLREGPLTMTFCVQPQLFGEPIEDSSKVWSNTPIPVAEIKFLPVTQPILESDGEALSFNPWRVLEEHRPLGWPGRTRLRVYQADFEWRSRVNKSSAQ